MTIDYTALTAPFLDDDIEWKVERSFGDTVIVNAYVDQRAIIERLDAVVGAENWQTQTHRFPGGCDAGIGIRCEVLPNVHEWVWKWDGAGQRSMNGPQSEVHAPKAAVSDAMKRAAMQWGMGRHLWSLPEVKLKLSSEKPRGVQANRVIGHGKGQDRKYAVAPSIRELQPHLLTIEQMTAGLETPKQRRLARVDAVRVKMGWAHPRDVPAGEVPRIVLAFEAASAAWRMPSGGTVQVPEGRGERNPGACSDQRLKIASHRLVKWYTDGVLDERMEQYGQWVMSGYGKPSEEDQANPPEAPADSSEPEPEDPWSS